MLFVTTASVLSAAEAKVTKARLHALRPRIADALQAHLRYIDALALRELKNRRSHVRAFLEPAQLELARTYDLATGR